MNYPKRPVNVHEGYHAHVYFDAQTVAFATQLCRRAGQLFGLSVGRVHQQLVGPHTRWSCQISFYKRDFERFIPWLDDNRQGLSVLVHGCTGEHLKDHTAYAYWLGEAVDLDLSIFYYSELFS